MVTDRRKKFAGSKAGQEVKAEADQDRGEQRDTDTLRWLSVCRCLYI